MKSFATTLLALASTAYAGDLHLQKNYFFSTYALNMDDAMVVCKTWGGKLAKVDNVEQQNLINASVDDVPYYIGLNDVAKEGEWRWSTGKSRDGPLATFTNWAPGEPNNYNTADGKENCAVLNVSGTLGGNNYSGKWNDVPCDYKQRFICQQSSARCISSGNCKAD